MTTKTRHNRRRESRRLASRLADGCATKNFDMTEERLIILNGYITYIYYTRHVSYDYAGRYIKAVQRFLEDGTEINKRGYNKYVRENSFDLANEPVSKQALLDFLDYIGVGYNRKKKKSELKSLEKLSTISDKNKSLINDFIFFLTQHEDYSENTLKYYHISLKKYFEYATEVSVDNYKRFVKTMEDDGLSAATIRLRITALERLSDFVKKPIRLKRPKFKRKLDTDNVPTEQEYDKLLAYLLTTRNKDHYFFVKILATTGARVSEFLQFKWEDITSGEVTLRGKGNKYRRFFFNKSLQKEVAAYVKEYGKHGTVAVGKYGTLTERGLNQNMKTWADKCGIDRKKLHPHAFRHFFAKMFLKKTKDVIQLADLLGHGSVDTTRIYLQKSYDEQKKEFNRCVTW